MMMMIAFITIKSSLVPLIEGLCEYSERAYEDGEASQYIARGESCGSLHLAAQKGVQSRPSDNNAIGGATWHLNLYDGETPESALGLQRNANVKTP